MLVMIYGKVRIKFEEKFKNFYFSSINGSEYFGFHLEWFPVLSKPIFVYSKVDNQFIIDSNRYSEDEFLKVLDLMSFI